jgi:glucose-6-phosphate isomerase
VKRRTLFEMQTAIAGALLNINTFDQPGVEAGKIATDALSAVWV